MIYSLIIVILIAAIIMLTKIKNDLKIALLILLLIFAISKFYKHKNTLVMHSNLKDIDLKLTTVSQGTNYTHHCYLAACTAVYNYLMSASNPKFVPISIDKAWSLVKEAPKKDRIRTTFQKMLLPSNFQYMAGISYDDKLIEIIKISISNGWPLIAGIGSPNESTSTIGHYVIISGINANNTKIKVNDPWNAKPSDKGEWVDVPKKGTPLKGIRASKYWQILELYFAKNYKEKLIKYKINVN